LAVCETLAGRGFRPEIKWPNDVLIGRRKVCGVLAEAVWLGDRVDSLVLGIGLNVLHPSVPPAEALLYPATCLEAEMPSAGSAWGGLDRSQLLRDVLSALAHRRPEIGLSGFVQAWEARLAFRGEPVEIVLSEGVSRSGQLEGLEADGSLRLREAEGGTFTVQYGDVHLRPLV
jgi:BirA family biotin operon repressor/biotin-[acetyl-CoA-carboxylase] ligase